MSRSSGIVFGWEPYNGSATPSATVLADRSRMGNDGAITGATWVRLPRGLWVLYFDGVNNKVTIPDSPSLALGSSFTISVWINPDSDCGDNTTIVEKVLAYYLRLGILADGYFGSGGVYPYGSSGGARAFSGSPIPVSAWTHIIFLYSGTYTQIYVNGALNVTEASSGVITANSNDVGLGLKLSDSSGDYKGYMGLVTITRAISAGEILQLFNAERHFFGV